MIGNAHLIKHALVDTGHAAQPPGHLNGAHLACVAVPAPLSIQLSPGLFHGGILRLLLFGRFGRQTRIHILDKRGKPLDRKPVGLAGLGQQLLQRLVSGKRIIERQHVIPLGRRISLRRTRIRWGRRVRLLIIRRSRLRCRISQAGTSGSGRGGGTSSATASILRSLFKKKPVMVQLK